VRTPVFAARGFSAFPTFSGFLAVLTLAILIFSGALSGCASSGAGGGALAQPAAPVVLPAPPPKDDGTPAQGGRAGQEHARALEQLKTAGLGWGVDRQGSVRVPLPDAQRWTRVKFWGMKSLVGFRYGKDHHAVVGALILPVPDEAEPGACGKMFEKLAQPYVDAFEVVIEHDPPRATTWNGKIADIDALVARTATLGMRDEYAVAYATYPAWPGQCLILGVAVPARDELERAKAVRDRFATEILPKVLVTAKTVPKETY
jgi:hypothetical protein